MPPAIAAVTVVAAYAAISTTFVLSTALMLASLAFSVVSMATAKRPKGGGAPDVQNLDRTVSTREPIGAHRICFGAVRIGGKITFLETTGTDPKYLDIVYTLSGHSFQGFREMWFGEEIVLLDGSGNATGRYAGYVTAIFATGTTAGDAAFHAALSANYPTKWTAAHRQSGCAKVYVRLKRNPDLFPIGVPNISFVVFANNQIEDPRYGTSPYTTGWTDNAALCIAWWLKSRYGFAGYVDADLLIAAANACDEIVARAQKDIDVSLDASANAIGVPNYSAALRNGTQFQIVTTGSLAGTGLTAGNTYYWCANQPIGTTGGVCLSLADARSQTTIDILGPGTGSHKLRITGEPRYTINGEFECTEDPWNVLRDMVTAMAGDAVRSSLFWALYAGVWRTPSSDVLTDDDLDAPLRVDYLVPTAELFNAVKGLFVNPDKNWQADSFPAVASETYEDQDNGVRRYSSVNYRFTNSPSMCQRIGRVALGQIRRQIRVQLPCKLSEMLRQAPDNVKLTNTRQGWTEKTFKLINFQFVQRDGEPPRMGIDLSLAETDAAIFDWSTSLELEPSAPSTPTLPSPFEIGAPSNLTLASGTEHLLQLAEGSVLSRIYATWDPVTTGYVVEYELQSKRSVDSDWLPTQIIRDAAFCYVTPVEDGVAYDVRVRTINYYRVRSAWTQASAHVVVGKTEPPDVPTNFTVARLADGTRRFAWVMDPLPADVRSGGGFNIYYTTGAGSPALTAMTALNSQGLIGSSPFESNELAAGTYVFALTAVDSSGNESAPTYANVTLGDPRLRSVLLQQLEHELAWPGGLTNCYIDTDNVVRAGPAQGSPQADWASLAGKTWATLPSSWEQITPRADPIVYRTNIIDLGSNVNFSPLLTFVGNGTATFRMASGVSGQSPTVDGFGPVAPVVAKRYVQFEISITGAPARLQQLTILLDGETQVDEFNDIDTATETAIWFTRVAAGHIRVGTKSGLMSSITMAEIIAIQNVTFGHSWVLLSKTAAVNGSPGTVAAEFKIFNQAGTLVDAVIDVELRGPKVTS